MNKPTSPSFIHLTQDEWYAHILENPFTKKKQPTSFDISNYANKHIGLCLEKKHDMLLKNAGFEFSKGGAYDPFDRVAFIDEKRFYFDDKASLSEKETITFSFNELAFWKSVENAILNVFKIVIPNNHDQDNFREKVKSLEIDEYLFEFVGSYAINEESLQYVELSKYKAGSFFIRLENLANLAKWEI